MRELTFSAAAREGLAEEMERDPAVFVFGEGIGARGGNWGTTTGLYDRFGPWRLRDTPISERGFTGMATGAALVGARPIVDFMFLDFLLDAMGEIVNQMAKMQYMSDGRVKMPVVLRGCIGVGHSSATHHSGNYYPFLARTPGLHVVVPATPSDAKGLLKTAIRSDDPVFFLEHKSLLNVKGPVPDEEYLVPLGQAAVAREGTDATVVALTWMLHRTLEACDLLARDGVSIEVIDPRSLAPLDMDTILASVHKTGRLLIVDEDYGPFGVGAEIAAQVMARAFDDLDAPVARLNGASAPTPYSPPLEAAVVPNTQTITQAIRDLLAE
ncbi:MAG TPA: alpha-ketoacid dehydrogenase subunit beta [Chloroflexota bacterium]|nr:alpha-ketoacid dehydrogenase subunit beta [Chloroflexota bacterium]